MFDRLYKNRFIFVFLILSLFLFSNCGEFKQIFGKNGQSSQQKKKKQKTYKNKKTKAKKQTRVSKRSSSKKKSQKKSGRKSRYEKYIWPVQGKLSSGFGRRNGRPHDGIDILAPRGTPVKAAKSGTVIFSGQMSGYGNIVIVKHVKNYFTAYAHLHRIKAKKNQRVKQGQTIGTVGRTGRASANHLHFEVRYRSEAKDPMNYLP